jgi:hypothetical protein
MLGVDCLNSDDFWEAPLAEISEASPIPKNVLIFIMVMLLSN